MKWENIIYEIGNGIAIVTLNRVQSYNVLSKELLEELEQGFTLAAQDGSVKVLLICGQRNFFSAGADIDLMLNADAQEALQFSNWLHSIFDKLEDMAKPVIAAASGLALGGGCELFLACDLRLAAEGTKFGLPEIKLGIIPGAGGTQRLSRLIGQARAKEMIFSGNTIEASQAQQIGLVNKVVAPEMLLDEAKAWALELADRPGLALDAAKRTINYGLSCDLHAAKMIERESFARLFATEDQKEGMRAFKEKRKPSFKS